MPFETANQMVGNVIGRFTLPFAICPDGLVMGEYHQVPSGYREPSVVAAASHASKFAMFAVFTTIHDLSDDCRKSGFLMSLDAFLAGLNPLSKPRTYWRLPVVPTLIMVGYPKFGPRTKGTFVHSAVDTK